VDSRHGRGCIPGQEIMAGPRQEILTGENGDGGNPSQRIRDHLGQDDLKEAFDN